MTGPTLDVAALSSWLDEQGVVESTPSAPIDAVTAVTGGTQNVMLRLRRGESEYILRRGPAHLRPGSNAVIGREMRLLQALADTRVPHPGFVAGCTDLDRARAIIGDEAVFYLMQPVSGFCAGTALPQLHQNEPGVRRHMGLAMARALAELGGVDYQAVGLEGFGKPEGFLDRQVDRWLGELASYASLPHYPGPQIGPVEAIAQWLRGNTPKTFTPGILHGDFHASNVLFSLTGPEVTAIVDWEMATIGDPLLDLGWLLATWDLPEAPLEFGGELTRAGGLATPAELIAEYASQSDRDLSALRYYVVLACFKLGLILEGSYARALAGLAPMEIGQRLHHTTCLLLARATHVIESKEYP